jgi:hypothetical protein
MAVAVYNSPPTLIFMSNVQPCIGEGGSIRANDATPTKKLGKPTELGGRWRAGGGDDESKTESRKMAHRDGSL